MTNIEDCAFLGCNSLQKIILPTSLKNISGNPFYNCKCLIVNNSPYYKIKENVLYNSNMTILILYLSDQTKFTIPNSVTKIENHAFSNCKSLQEIIIPKSVTNIGDYAFSNCSLQKIVIPESVTNIGYRAFSNCSLQGIVIPKSVTNIRIDTFYCSSLRKIKIPKGYKATFEQLLSKYKDKLIEI